MVSTQKRNSEMVDLLRPDFQARYEPNFAWVNAMSAFQMLPGLRGVWPMSAVGDSVGGVNSDVTDMSGQGRHLTNTGQAQHTYLGLAPVVFFDGANDYLSRADEAGFDIIGNEAYIGAAANGLTIGGWFDFLTLPVGANKGVIGKYAAANISYLLYMANGTSVVTFGVSNGGAAFSATVNSTVTISAGAFNFIVARYDPSTEISVFVNGTEDTNAVGIPATLFNGNAAFEVMSFSGGSATTRNHGYVSTCFLTASYLPDYYINALFQQTRALFGV